MPSPSWKKAPQALVQRFDQALPAVPDIVRKPMFGYPGAFVHGHLCCSLFRDRVIARVGAAEAAALVASGVAEAFAPMPGSAMKDYVRVPRADAARADLLAPWLARALAFARTLPAKAPKAEKQAKASPVGEPATKALPRQSKAAR